MQAVIAERSASGYSWVASKSDDIVAVALARPDAYEQKRAIYLDYIVVDPDARERKICATLVEKLKATGLVITADVLRGNHSSMVDILMHFGFEKIESDDNKTKLKWSPPMAETTEKKR
jgi:N-acetylglutamate synthase-like GNAT family acetyltransferase